MDFLVLTKTGGILGPFATVLGFIINIIYSGLEAIGIPNIGLAIILFTIIVNIILLPLTIKQQRTTKLMSVMNPELQKIQAKYKGKTDEVSARRMQAETSAVYQKYGTSPTGGCLYLLIQMPILFALYRVIYNVPAYVSSVNDLYMQIAQPLSQVTGGGEIISGLIESLSLRVTNFDFTNTSSIIDFLAALKTTDWSTLSESFSAAPAVVDAINTVSPEIIGVNSIIGGLNMTDLPMTNGIWPGVLVPILAGASQWFSMKLTSANQQEQSADNQMANSMKTMNSVMPLFSIFLCFSFNIGIGIYWIASSVVRTAAMLIVNKAIDAKGIDKIVEENKEKAKKKAEKRGDQPSKFEEYAKMSTKNFDESQPKRKSIKELANTSTMTAAEKAQAKKEAKNPKKEEVKENVSELGKEKNYTDEENKSSTGKKGKKNQEPENISAIAHMLDGKQWKK